LQGSGSKRIGKAVLMSFFIGMGRVNYGSLLPAILDANHAWRAGFGPSSRLFDRGTFDRVRRRSLRQLGGERPILRRFAFRCGRF
jgi:hypothetical protein